MKIEGKNPVMEAIKAGNTIDRLIVAKGLSDSASNKVINEAKARGIKMFFRDKDTLDRESISKRHQGFIAEITDYKYAELQDILNDCNNASSKINILLLLDGIEDPHNLGSIIRVGECMGVRGILIPRHRSVSVNETVIKVSQGATQHVRIAKVTNINDAINSLKDSGFFVYASELGGQDISDTKWHDNTALVIGGESKGVHTLTKKLCDCTVSIPMQGKLNSLNASVATGIVLHQIVMSKLKQ